MNEKKTQRVDEAPIVLEARGITKQFPGVLANDRIDLALRKGEILALAIMIMGKWTPLGSWGAALLFGFTYAMQTQLQFWGVNLPPQFIGSMPYILTIFVLAGFVGRSRAPAASGVPYEKGG